MYGMGTVSESMTEVQPVFTGEARDGWCLLAGISTSVLLVGYRKTQSVG